MEKRDRPDTGKCLGLFSAIAARLANASPERELADAGDAYFAAIQSVASAIEDAVAALGMKGE